MMWSLRWVKLLLRHLLLLLPCGSSLSPGGETFAFRHHRPGQQQQQQQSKRSFVTRWHSPFELTTGCDVVDDDDPLLILPLPLGSIHHVSNHNNAISVISKTSRPPRPWRSIRSVTRRQYCRHSMTAGRAFCLLAASTATCYVNKDATTSATAAVLPGDPQEFRRPLELCLTTVLRVLYWAQSLSSRLLAPQPGDTTTACATTTTTNAATAAATATITASTCRDTYLEARLGAKALLTGRFVAAAGGEGTTTSTSVVRIIYTLSTLQVRSSLDNLVWYAAAASSAGSGGNRHNDQVVTAGGDAAARMREYGRDLWEGLASLVEFDGFDSLSDPSPRVSFIMGQMTPAKVQLIQRTLSEQIIPTGHRFVQLWSVLNPAALDRAIQYIQAFS